MYCLFHTQRETNLEAQPSHFHDHKLLNYGTQEAQKGLKFMKTALDFNLARKLS